MTAKLIAILDASGQVAEVAFVKCQIHAKVASVMDGPAVSHGALPAQFRIGRIPTILRNLT
jgi:hypothetical protein